MTNQWTATALAMALGLAAPAFAQDDPMGPNNDPTQRQTNPSTQPDDGIDRGTAPAPAEEEMPAPADKTSSADRERAVQQGAELSGEQYVVQSGDTLSGLAERFLGSSDRWKQIADANGIQNPDMISVGQKLEIPEKGADAGAAPARRSMDDEAAPESQ